MPNIPVSVWEQIPVVIVFSFLVAGLGWFLSKVFLRAISDINQHYDEIIKDNNLSWQAYIDRNTEKDRHLKETLLVTLEKLESGIQELLQEFKMHDLMERQALDEMYNKRKLSKKP